MTKSLGLLLLTLIAAFAQSGRFKVGDAVESEYAGSWTAGVVVEVMTGSNNGWYKIRYDGGKVYAADGARMRAKGAAPQDRPFSNDPAEAFGTWILSTVAQNTRTSGSAVYRDTTLYGQGDSLTIQKDNTYVWKMGSETIRGRWKAEPNPEQYRGPILLENGWQQMRWWVGYNGRTPRGQDSVYIRSEVGTRYWGWRQ